ncbi:CIC11C00000002042 [Sungouiella intermedia]|uniref:CIC11C00000002042 n=1 Tax=Sungouiella intermedia TaxID=45354 RepID=A0A1L0BZZ4_9ASCO|nr:CIC11C00000002042 [[Candida] intermedia]
MSIVAAIDQRENISVWSRSVNSLASILDHVRFSFCRDSIMLLAVNSSRTANGEIVFTSLFFRELTFSTDYISSEGFVANELDYSSSTYSFIVSSKHLVMLFKNLDSSSLNYICLRVDCRSDTPLTRRYKLMVEVLTKKLIVKKFHMNYLPVTGDLNTVVSQYKEEYEKGNVRYFQAETATFKLFFDMVPGATEDFSIEVKMTKIVFGAYTKQVLKDREFLKQPMLITILMSTEELLDTNLGDINAVVNFRLKDIRNFINLCTAMKSDALDNDMMGVESHFNTYFKSNGDPIVFEYKAQNLTVAFIQITAEDSAKPELKSTTKPYTLPAPAIQKVSEEKLANWTPAVSTYGKRDVAQLSRLDVTVSKLTSAPASHEEYEELDNFQYSLQNITYGKRASTPIEPDSVKRARDDTDYSTSDDNAPQEQVQEFGPTQHETYKPKSLFD